VTVTAHPGILASKLGVCCVPLCPAVLCPHCTGGLHGAVLLQSTLLL
jgi:hypothetical protein